MPDNQTEITDNQVTEVKSKRGGYRIGAGRPAHDSNYVQRWAKARGYNPIHASEILATVIDERRVWRRLLTSEQDGIVLAAMVFLTQMRDGKPAQRVDVTSTSVNIDVSEIDKVREIIRSVVTPRLSPVVDNPDTP